MSSFNVGDKVRVRNNLELGKSYSCVRLISSMFECKGQIVTIKKIWGNRAYHVKEEEVGYIWGEDMFEPIGPIEGDINTIVECIIMFLSKHKLTIKDIKCIISNINKHYGESK